MAVYTISDVRRVLYAVTEEMVAQKSKLTEIDSKLGDGDMGISMEKAAQAIRAVLDENMEGSPGKVLMLCASACNRAAPSTLGTLLSIGIMTVGQEAGDSPVLEDAFVAHIPALLTQSISKRGKAQEGDKTILDALCPYARAMEAAYTAGKTLRQAAVEAADAAWAGMKSTQGKAARIGRAKWLAERNKEYPDGGAYLCAQIARHLCSPNE